MKQHNNNKKKDHQINCRRFLFHTIENGVVAAVLFYFVYIALIGSHHFLHIYLVALIGGHIATRSKVNSARDCTTTHGRAPIQYFLLFTLCIVQICR